MAVTKTARDASVSTDASARRTDYLLQLSYRPTQDKAPPHQSVLDALYAFFRLKVAGQQK